MDAHDVNCCFQIQAERVGVWKQFDLQNAKLLLGHWCNAGVIEQ